MRDAHCNLLYDGCNGFLLRSFGPQNLRGTNELKIPALLQLRRSPSINGTTRATSTRIRCRSFNSRRHWRIGTWDAAAIATAQVTI